MTEAVRLSQHDLDEWFPTLVRYAGFVLLLVLVTASIRGHTDYPSGYIAATGMILYKTVSRAAAARDNDDDEVHK